MYIHVLKSNTLSVIGNMLIHQVLTFMIQINYAWSAYLDKFWMPNTKTLYYHKAEMDDSDYEVIMSLCHQVNDLGYNYWNGLNLPKTGNALIVLDDVEPDYMKKLLKQDGIQKSLFSNIWVIHSTKQENCIHEYFSQTNVRIGFNANIFFVTSYSGKHNVTQIIGTGTFSVKLKHHGILDYLDLPSIIQGTLKRVDFEGTTLIANYATNFPPYCFVGQDGSIRGIMPDALKTAARFMNLTLKFQKPKKENIDIWDEM